MTRAGEDPFSRLLYPMLVSQTGDDPALLASLAAAPLVKARETDALRARLVADGGDRLLDCADAIADAVARGGRVLTCGNGGSATTAADLVTDLMAPPPPHRPIPALSLSADVAVVTALANDIGAGAIFTRQLMSLGRAGDVLVAVSTSGGSENLVRCLLDARARGIVTVALTGYDGGRMVAEGNPDHALVVPSASVHRIQEAQTAVCHLLVELIRIGMEERTACA